MTEPLVALDRHQASLVDRLRAMPDPFGHGRTIHNEAAAEIERLRAELEEAYHAVRVYAGHIDEFTKGDLRRAGLVSKKVEQR